MNNLNSRTYSPYYTHIETRIFTKTIYSLDLEQVILQDMLEMNRVETSQSAYLSYVKLKCPKCKYQYIGIIEYGFVWIKEYSKLKVCTCLSNSLYKWSNCGKI